MKLKIFTFLLIILNFACTKNMKESYIDLSGKKLKNIPDSVYLNKNLTHLNLGNSELIIYPPLSQLVHENANSISNLKKIGELTNLKTLILNTNQITSLPESIVNLQNLEILDLSINRDLKIANEIDKINQLSKLNTLLIVDVNFEMKTPKDILNKLNKNIKVIYQINDDYINFYKNYDLIVKK